MTNIDHAAKIIDAWTQDGHELNSHVGDPGDLARALSDAGLLAPDPQIIRTREELAALDPDTLVNNFNDFLGFTADLSNGDGSLYTWAEIYLPAVVIATGDQIRAARQALEERK